MLYWSGRKKNENMWKSLGCIMVNETNCGKAAAFCDSYMSRNVTEVIDTDIIWTQFRCLLATKKFSHGIFCINGIMSHTWTVSGIKSFPKYAYLRLVGHKLYAEGTIKWLKTHILLSQLAKGLCLFTKQACAGCRSRPFPMKLHQ